MKRSGFSCWCGNNYGLFMGCALHTPMSELLPYGGITKRERERQLKVVARRERRRLQQRRRRAASRIKP